LYALLAGSFVAPISTRSRTGVFFARLIGVSSAAAQVAVVSLPSSLRQRK
jgi:hypothetical protein